MNELSFQQSPYHTALRCLFLVARHHGIEITPERLAATNPSDPLNSVRSVMREVGLKSTLLTERAWKDVIALGTAYPTIAFAKDGGWAIVVGIIPNAAGETSLAVLNPRV